MSERVPATHTPPFLRQILHQWDAKPDDFDEHSLESAIEEATKEQGPLSEQDRRACVAEAWAFGVDTCQPEQTSVWGTHFGPVLTWRAEDGNVTRSTPDIRVLDSAVIAYWEVRKGQARHPVMRARYADLLWDLRKTVTGERPRADDARDAIDAYIDTTTLDSKEFAHHRIGRLQRAIELGILINDHARIEATRDAMFELFDGVSDPHKGGTWPFLFDTLCDNKKVPLTPEQQDKLVSSLESILSNLSVRQADGTLYPFGAKEAAKRLARHYQRTEQLDEMRRVIRAYGQAFETMAKDAGGLLALTWLQDVYEDYRQAGMKEDADRVLLLMKKKGKAAEGEMKKVSAAVPIDKKEMDAALAELTAGNLDDTLKRIAIAFVPRVEHAKGILQDLSKSSLLAHMGTTIVGDQQILAEIGSIESDLEGNLVNQLGQNIDLASGFLATAIDHAREKFRFGTEELLHFLLGSALFDPQRELLYRHGLDAYLARDHVKVIHVLVPQIEQALRTLLILLGRPTSKPMRSPKGLMGEKTLTDILENDPAVPAFFKQIGGEDCWYYLRVFLTDPKGHNLRNRLAHGLIGPAGFDRTISDRVIHILLMLALIGRSADHGEE